MAREHYGELAFAMQCSLVMQRIKLSKVERMTKKRGMAAKGDKEGRVAEEENKEPKGNTLEYNYCSYIEIPSSRVKLGKV